MLFILASAADTRCSELFALKPSDVDFKAGTLRVDESSDQRTKGKIGLCKNVAAYRTIVMHDHEGKEALRLLRTFLKKYPQPNPNGLIFHSRRNTPLLETNVLHDGLHPALLALGLPQAGLHAFRRGCNQRWELSGLNPAVIRQQMGHSSATMTALYTGQIPERSKQRSQKSNLPRSLATKLMFCKMWKMSLLLKCFKIWSGRWESNPRPKLGKLLYCHCTTPALCSNKANYIQVGRLRYRCALYTTHRYRLNCLAGSLSEGSHGGGIAQFVDWRDAMLP
jgi:hypothetical protein